MLAVILAAGMGSRLRSVAGDIPKCLVPVAGTALLDRMLFRLQQANVDEVVVVTGHLDQQVAAHIERSSAPLARATHFVHNPRYQEWNNFYSLLVVEDVVAGREFLKIDGDVLIDDRVFPIVLQAPGPGVLAIDAREDLGSEEMKVRVDDRGRIIELNKRIAPSSAGGEYIGIDRIAPELAPAVFSELRTMIDDGETDEYYERAYERLIQAGRQFSIADVTDTCWCEIDDANDLRTAETLNRALS